MFASTTRHTRRRSRSGSLGSVILAAIVLVGCALGAIAVDVGHIVTVQGELQNACDAAALAGAADLTRDFNNVESRALAVAAMNVADGRPVSNDSPDTQVVVQALAPVGLSPGSVEVTAQMQIRHLLAPIFGRMTDTVQATATAGSSGSLRSLRGGQAFPLAVSLDTIPRRGPTDPEELPLWQRQVGDVFNLYINSQQVKNAAFTSLTHDPASAQWIRSAVDQQLGLSPAEPGFIPQVSVGDDINLNNGVVGQKHLAKSPRLEALLAQDLLILPVIQGDPPFNQSRPVVGFIGVKVIDVEINQSGGIVETITVELVKAIALGSAGQLGQTGSPEVDAGLSEISVTPVQLISGQS